MSNEDPDKLYCSCRRPYNPNEFMIGCDVCQEWFHGSCVGIKEGQEQDIERYHCPTCEKIYGPLVLKSRPHLENRHHALIPNLGTKIKTGTAAFIKELRKRSFHDPKEIIVKLSKGYELTKEYLEKNGFGSPILVQDKGGLDLLVPNTNFTVNDVEKHVGSMREIDVIDVALQDDMKMYMREWTEYYNDPNKKRILNVISLEFSNTPLEKLVVPPRIVRELSWVSNYWPEHVPEDKEFEKPEVQRYCLMGVKDSYTDFHVDFGGTSVWYHILKGEKVFYLIKPTSNNLLLYEQWVSSANQGEMFFGDQVEKCYKVTITAGNTLFIPTGWIHAVLTPEDSLVFGGNFLHSFNIELQIQAYEMEQRANTPEKYLFPNYEVLHWYAAKHILDTLKEFAEEEKEPPKHLMEGGRALAVALKTWTQKQDYIGLKNTVPEAIPYSKILKELYKLTRHIHLGKIHDTDERERRKKKKSSSKKEDKRKAEKRKKKKEKEKTKTAKESDKSSLDNLPWPSAFSMFENTETTQRRNSVEEETASSDSLTIDDQRPKKGLKLKLSTAQSASNDSSTNLADIFNTSNLTQGYNTPYSKEMPDRTPADMRDAIQGMLSMSRGLHVNSNESGESAFEFRSKLPSKKKEQRISESSPTHRDVYKDEEFVYPSLDLSDSEEKPPSKIKEEKDDNWNPRAKVQPLTTTKEKRPQRPNAKREAVEQGLAAAAANPSPIKKHYSSQSKKKRKSHSPTNNDWLDTASTVEKKEAQKKPKKGMSTTKQRLGKLLNIKRMYQM